MASVKSLGEKLEAGGEDFKHNKYFNGKGFLPAPETKKAEMVVDGLLKGAELTARTAVPLRDFAVVNLRWGFKVPPWEAAEEMDAVVVGKTNHHRMAGMRLLLLVMDKIGIEHVAKANSKKEKPGPTYDDMADAFFWVKKTMSFLSWVYLFKSKCNVDYYIATFYCHVGFDLAGNLIGGEIGQLKKFAIMEKILKVYS